MDTLGWISIGLGVGAVALAGKYITSNRLWDEYQNALNSGDQHRSLEAGRKYYSNERSGKGTRALDEQRINNDIAAMGVQDRSSRLSINPNKRKNGISAVTAFLFAALIGTCNFIGDESTPPNPSASGSLTTTSASTAEENYTKAIALGEPMHSEYFDVTISKVEIRKSISTGNQYMDVPAEDGAKFLVLHASFKNTDNESRMITDGDVIVDYNGKQYNFDKAETVLADGWSTQLDQINPLLTKKTKIAYKIPSEVTGRAYYRAGRSTIDQVIHLGEIK